MAENNTHRDNNDDQGQMPFWEFMRSIDPHSRGFGVDHVNGPEMGSFGGPRDFDSWGGGLGGPWGGPWGGHWGGGWGRGGHGRGRRAHHHRRGGFGGPDSDREEHHEEAERAQFEEPSETMRESPDAGPAADDDGSHPPPPPPPGAFPHHHRHHHHPHPHGPHPFGPGPHRRRGGGGGGRGRGREWGHRGPPPPPPHWNGPFDFRPLMNAFASHPFAQAMREYVDQTRTRATGEQQDAEQDDNTFVPPVDIFNTEKAYVLHISLPGAVKEDIGVDWDADKSLLNVAGVVYRPGNEEFQAQLASSERKVGMFERAITLPPPGSDDKEEIDGFSITAKMENGILIVTVPKAEKEWTEIHKVDVE